MMYFINLPSIISHSIRYISSLFMPPESPEGGPIHTRPLPGPPRNGEGGITEITFGPAADRFFGRYKHY